MRLNPPAQLLPDGAVIDIPGLFWHLEGTIGENPGVWGWAGKECVICRSEDVVLWSWSLGYRCADHVIFDACPDCKEPLEFSYAGWMWFYLCRRCNRQGCWPVPAMWSTVV